MEHVLVVSSSDKGATMLIELLKMTPYSQVTVAKSGNEARRLVHQTDFSLVCINAPLSDEFGHELAMITTEQSNAGVILIVKNEQSDAVSAKVEASGVFVVGKPLSRPFFFQAIKLVAASRKRIMGLQTENNKLQTKIEEIRLVNRAKYVLMQYLNMTEPQAHRYIEKQAMDMRVTRREVAEGILKTYES